MKRLHPFLPFLGHLLLWVLVTWPLVLDLDTSFVVSRFASSHLWIFDTVVSGWNGRIPLWLWERGYPAGGAVVLIGWPALALFAVFRTFCSALAAYNLTQLVLGALAGAAAHALARRQGVSERAAGVGGIAYGVSGYILSIVYIGEIPNFCHAFLPLLLLAVDACGRSWRAPFAGALAWTALLSATPYYGLLSIWLVIAYAIGVLGRDRSLATLGRLVLFAALCAAPSIVLLRYFNLLRDLAPNLHLLRPATGALAVFGERDTWLFMEATLDGLVKPGKAGVPAGTAIQIGYLGVVPLALAALAWTRRRRWLVAGWWAAALVAIALMLGDHLAVGSGMWQTAAGNELILPLGALKKWVPVLQMIHVPYRAAVVATLCLAMLAALAVDKVGRRWFAGFAAAALLVDTLLLSPTPWPLPVVHDPVPAPYHAMGEDPADYAVLPFPFECVPQQGIGKFQRYFYDATVHHKRVPWGDRLTRDRNTLDMGARQVISEPFVVGLCGLLDEQVHPAPARSTDVSWLASVGVRWVVVHVDLRDAAQVAPVRQYLEARLGPARERTDGVELYAVGTGTITPAMLGPASLGATPWPAWLYTVDHP
ncbi:MAG: hypothetical protein V4850_27525 [Myxococcota bacterium]